MLHFSVYYKAFQNAHASRFFWKWFSYIAYRSFHLSSILTKLDHFMLLKKKHSYDLRNKTLNL